MKTTTKFILTIIILISINTVSAQYGNGYGGNGYGGNGYGNGMNQMGGMNQNSQPEKPKEIPVETRAAKIMENMKPAVNLDELQTIAITNVLIESLNTQGRILKQDTTQDEQVKDFQALSENTDRQIMNFLNNQEQKDKYLAFKEEQKQPKKSNNKEKGKRNHSSQK